MLAELRTDEPVACLAGQPLVIRSHCAATTYGGGRVLDPDAEAGIRWSATDLGQLRQLGSPDPLERISAALYLNGMKGFDPQRLARRAGFDPPPPSLLEPLAARRQVARLQLDEQRQHLVHAQVLDRFIDRIEGLLEKQHQRNPLKRAFPPSSLQKIFDPVAVPGLMQAVIRRMEASGKVVRMPAGLALPGYAPQLSKRQQREYARILQVHRDADYAPPTLDELVSGAQSHRESVPTLVELAVAEGHLVRICSDWCLHWEIEREMRRKIHAQWGSKPFAVSDLRALLQTSRKYLVPLCEYLDRIGFTERGGNLRTVLGPDVPRRTECY